MKFSRTIARNRDGRVSFSGANIRTPHMGALTARKF
jgi:hypothetical protein